MSPEWHGITCCDASPEDHGLKTMRKIKGPPGRLSQPAAHGRWLPRLGNWQGRPHPLQAGAQPSLDIWLQICRSLVHLLC